MANYWAFSGYDNLGGADIATLIGGTTAPSDSNPGTITAPFLTIPFAQSQMVAGDNLYIDGVHYIPDATAYAFTKTNVANIGIRAGGRVAARIKLSNKIGTTGWTAVGGGVYTLLCTGAVGTAPDLRGKVASISQWVVDYDWTSNRDTTTLPGLRIIKCVVPILASAVAAAGAAGSAQGGAFLDNTTGLFTLGLPTGQAAPSAPNANGIEYVYKARSGIGALGASSTAWVIDGLTIGPIFDPGTAPLSCGIATQAGGHTISNNHIEYPGIHGISCGSGVTNLALVNNAYHGGASTCYHEVFNPGVGTTATNCRSYNAIMGGWTPLGCDGLYIAASTNIGGMLTHGDANSCADVEWVNPQFKQYIPPSGTPCQTIAYALADGPAPSSDNPEKCGTRIRQYNPAIWAVKDATGIPTQSITHYVGLINTRMDHSQFRSVNVLGCIDMDGVTGKLIAFGCDFTATISNPAGGTYMFSCGAASSAVLVNCSVYDNSTQAQHSGAQAYTLFNYSNAAAAFTVKGSILGFRDVAGSGTRGLCSGDGAIAAGSHLFTDNGYWNIGATLFSANATFNANTEWLDVATGIDKTGFEYTANPFADVTGASLALTATEKARRKMLATRAPYGSNAQRNGGQYGSNQTPAGRLRMRAGGSRRGCGPR